MLDFETMLGEEEYWEMERRKMRKQKEKGGVNGNMGRKDVEKGGERRKEGRV